LTVASPADETERAGNLDGGGRPFAGQVAVVTGASRGIGRATALALAAAGARVVLAARGAEALAAVAREVEQAGGEALALPADVADERQAEALIAGTLARFGQLDILINNAGVIGPIAPAWQTVPAAWRRTVDVNLFGVFAPTHFALPAMIARGRGQIVSVTSGAGSPGTVITGWSAYSAAKAGVDHFTRVLAAETRPHGIRVNAVAPGVTDTAMQEEIRAAPEELFGRENAARFRRLHAEGQLRPPEAPARLILWVLTQPDMTGQIVNIADEETRRRAGIS
jgi:NAD(P)-dependent dehydrogenase (short-subunit alcohol dehydrogenase family)